MSSPPLAIRLFGPMRVLVHGEPLPRVRTRSVEWLLALLVLRHGRTVDRGWLAGTLWMDSEESQALRNLREDLVRLRKALGGERGRLQSPSRDTLTLDLDGAEVDLLAFDKALRVGDEAGLRSAVALYTGPLLEGCYEDWVTQERERREQECLHALETLADRAEARDDFSESLALMRRAEGMDALRDSIQQRLMRALVAGGDTPAALMAYREHRLRLRREMNAEPDAETTRLFQQIRTEGRGKRASEARRECRSVGEGRGNGNTLTPRHLNTSTPAVAAPRLTSLPHPLTALIGREEAVREVIEQIAISRLVTLVGTGGVGKTRLCIQAARETAEQFPHGVAFVPLASLSDPGLLSSFVASSLGIRQEGSADAASPLQSLISWFSAQDILLVLDNCEHLIEATADLAQALLERCPRLHVLATSRQRLGLTGEIVWRVPSLPAPDPKAILDFGFSILDLTEPNQKSKIRNQQYEDVVLSYPAVRLFVERAQMAKQGFRLAGREDAETVARICQRLDGIPLAIELAAARTGVLTLPQIAARLDDRFRLLTGGSRGVLTRHQTLRALIDWSYDLLDAPERALLCRLSVFVDGWTLDACEAVCDGLTGVSAEWKVLSAESAVSALSTQHSALHLLASLTDKSLVLAEEASGRLRYRMLETVREYARERLGESGEEQTARERHADYYLALAEQAHPFLEKPERIWLDRLETEHDNLRAALITYTAEEGHVEKAVRLAASLERFWNLRGYFYERRVWMLNLARRRTPPTEARARLLDGAAHVVAGEGDFATAKRITMERLEIARQLGDRQRVAGALNALAYLVAGPEKDPIRGRALAEESLAIMRELGDRQGVAHVLFHLGHLARQVHDNDEARTRYRECLALDEALGVKGGHVLPALGDLALESGDPAAARGFFERFVSERYAIGDHWCVAWGLQGLGTVALAQGQAERAARLLAASLALRESFSLAPLTPGDSASYEGLRSALRDSLDEFALDAAWATGRSMSLEQAVAHALTPPYGITCS